MFLINHIRGHWQPVPDHEGYYVSDIGEVYRRTCTASDGKVLQPKRLTPDTNVRTGYQTVTMEGDRKYLHRLVMECFRGVQPNMDVNHKNRRITDNRIDNLEYCTRAENCRHAAENPTGTAEDVQGELFLF